MLIFTLVRKPGRHRGVWVHPACLWLLSLLSPGKPAELQRKESTDRHPFQHGDKVKCLLDIDILREMQEGHGGWNPKMAEVSAWILPGSNPSLSLLLHRSGQLCVTLELNWITNADFFSDRTLESELFLGSVGWEKKKKKKLICLFLNEPRVFSLLFWIHSLFGFFCAMHYW